MKRIALISSFCDDEIKLKCLKKNILNARKFGLDILVLSPIPLDEEVIKISDYVFYTKDNPVLDWPEKAMFYWKQFSYNNKTYKFSRTVPDYGWAGLHQVKQLSKIGYSLEYDFYYHMIYDLKMDDLAEHFLHTGRKRIYPSKRGETIWNYGLHFMIFNRENLKLFSDLITKELYNKFNSGNAFDCLEKIADIMNCDKGPRPVEDEIYYFENKDFFNFSQSQDFNFFVEKNDQTNSNIKLWFYNLFQRINLTVVVDGVKRNVTVDNFDNIDLGGNNSNIDSVEIIYNSEHYNITETIKTLKHNTVEIL